MATYQIIEQLERAKLLVSALLERGDEIISVENLLSALDLSGFKLVEVEAEDFTVLEAFNAYLGETDAN